MKIAVAGPPHSGKTMLSKRLGLHVVHTDDLIPLGWSEASAAAMLSFDDERSDLVIEGVAVPRALRKWLAAHPEGKPVDRVVWLERVYGELTPGQARMAKGCVTVWHQVLPELERRGVEIVYG